VRGLVRVYTELFANQLLGFEPKSGRSLSAAEVFAYSLIYTKGDLMTFMPWRDDFSVGLAEVDEQHQWLFDATNRLHNEMNKPIHSRAVIGEILEGLMNYTVNHFIMEEELFERYAYPQAQAHKALHDKFTASIMSMLTSFENGAPIENELLEILKDWLVEHIMKTDTAYVLFLKEKGGERFAQDGA
jgi:hemerythrin